MSFSLYVQGKDITSIALNLEWSSNIKTLGQTLSFSVPFDNENNNGFPQSFIEIGNKVTLRYQNEIDFFGIVVDEKINGRSPRQYTCFDLAFYLNKSDMTIQFNHQPADQCLATICKKFGIQYRIAAIPLTITKIYKGEKVNVIIQDILEIVHSKTGVKYRFEMQGATFIVYKWIDEKVTIYTRWMENPSRELNIENMRNDIEVIANGEKITKVSARASDANSIAKYGLLTAVEQVDEKELASAQNIANNKLRELNRIQESGGATFIGDRQARAGRLISLNEVVTGLNGDYLISDVKHTYNNGIHLMKLSWEVD